MARARAAKWQFVALHGKPTSSALDRTKARRLDDRPVSCQWVGTLHIDNYATMRGGKGERGLSCRHLSHGHCMFEANLLQATARSRSCLGHQHLAWLGSCCCCSLGLAMYVSLCIECESVERQPVYVCVCGVREAVSQLTLGQLSTSILESLCSAMSLLTTLPLINSSSTWPKHLLHQLDGHRLCVCVCV